MKIILHPKMKILHLLVSYACKQTGTPKLHLNPKAEVV